MRDFMLHRSWENIYSSYCNALCEFRTLAALILYSIRVLLSKEWKSFISRSAWVLPVLTAVIDWQWAVSAVDCRRILPLFSKKNLIFKIKTARYLWKRSKKFSKLRLPVGTPPPLGDRFFQNIVWLMCPPPLNLYAGSREIAALTSPKYTRAMITYIAENISHKMKSHKPSEIAWLSLSSVAFKLSTYVLWCLLWCSVIISSEIMGDRAP